jgi:peptidyl-prolyl cis-trans isomerase-like 4
MMGDLPFAEVKPPENVLFVCKLNPVTGDDDLELIFGRFGKILSCEVIRDAKTGDSLQYAFIEYEDKASCENAYFKMQGVLIDDRRIHVDFSQSVSKLSDVWRKDTNSKRRANASRGGWGGVDELEKRRQYRAEVDAPERNSYGMLYGDEEMKGRHERSGPRDRSGDIRSPREEGRERDTDTRSRSPRRRERHGDGQQGRRDGDDGRDRKDWGHRDRNNRYREGDRNRNDNRGMERDTYQKQAKDHSRDGSYRPRR